MQTVPSLALLGFLLPLPFIGGLGPRTALVTLCIYALLPIIRDDCHRHPRGRAGDRRGWRRDGHDRRGSCCGWSSCRSRCHRSWRACAWRPSIGVGTATIAAAIGAGGLGEYIFRGLSMVDTTTILAGAIPAALLALTADGLLAWLEQRVRMARVPDVVVRSSAAAALLVALLIGTAYARAGSDVVVVGSKNFTEQVLLGELVAQAIEAEGGVGVQRKLNLGGTFVADRGIRTGELDVYVEYTGTAVTAVFHEEVPHESALATRTRPRTIRARRLDRRGPARVQQHLRDPRSRRRCEGTRPAHDRRSEIGVGAMDSWLRLRIPAAR